MLDERPWMLINDFTLQLMSVKYASLTVDVLGAVRQSGARSSSMSIRLLSAASILMFSHFGFVIPGVSLASMTIARPALTMSMSWNVTPSIVVPKVLVPILVAAELL